LHLLKILPRLILTVVTMVTMTVILAPTLILISLFTSGTPAYHISRWWCWAVAKAMGLSFTIKGTEKVVPGKSYIITPNHQSNADILALLVTLPMKFRWVIKKELLRIPLFGWGLGRTGAISLDRSDRVKSVRRLQEGSSKLVDGWSVLIYPEGTRTTDGEVKEFKKGPFMMAVQTGIPILPVTCNGAFKILPKKTILFRPGNISITIGNPITTEGLSEKDVSNLMKLTRDEILAHFDPNYDPFKSLN